MTSKSQRRPTPTPYFQGRKRGIATIYNVVSHMRKFLLLRTKGGLHVPLFLVPFYGMMYACSEVDFPPLRKIVVPFPAGIKSYLLDVDAFFQTFLVDTYRFLQSNLSGTVVDIGAGVGDTAIYFARKGATVVAIEPVPSRLLFARRNIEINRLSERVLILNALVGKSVGYEEIESTQVPFVTVRELVRTTGIQHPSLLKCDCEGCEFEIDSYDFALFEKVVVEYHAYLTNIPPEHLVTKLRKAGFRHISLFRHPISYRDLNEEGIIYATRDEVRDTVS